MSATPVAEPGMQFPFPPYERRYGWRLSRGGAVRLSELRITLDYPNDTQFRRWLRQARAKVVRANWPGEPKPVQVLHFYAALRVVAAANAEAHLRTGRRVRDPP